MISPNRAENSKNIWNHHLDPTYEKKKKKNRALLLPLNWKGWSVFLEGLPAHSMWIFTNFFTTMWRWKKPPQAGHICSFKDWVIDPRFTWMIALGCPEICKKKSKKRWFHHPPWRIVGYLKYVYLGAIIWWSEHWSQIPREKIAALAVFPLEVSCSADAPCGNTTSRTEWSMKITIDWKRLYIYI